MNLGPAIPFFRHAVDDMSSQSQVIGRTAPCVKARIERMSSG